MAAKASNGQQGDRKYTINQALDLITGQLLENASYSQVSRSRLASVFTDPRRNIDDECGYRRTEELSIEDYRKFYDREPVATRVVEIMPRECWKVQPTVYESEDGDTVTEFEEAWDALGQSLSGAGFFRSEAGSPVWDYLMRADILSGIGHYGGLLLGIDDGKPLSEPADGMDETGQPVGKSVKERRLLYLRPLDESSLKVTAWEADEANPRFNKPREYSVTTARQFSSGEQMVSPSEMQTLRVHWSRVVHLADGGDTFAVPRMRPVFNRLYDIYKVCGSSGEMYYKGAFPGWSLEMLPELILAGHIKDIDTSAVKDQIENWQNGLQRVLFNKGLTMKNLGQQVSDPTSAVTLYIKMICIQLGIPERIFLGSERGELASSQDKTTWNDRVMGRQQGYLTPRVIVPFVDRLILVGVLPRPSEYYVSWPDLGAMTAVEKAGIAVQRMDAMTKYLQGGVGDAGIMQPMDLLTRELGYEDEEARAILEGAVEYKEERADETAEQQDAQAAKQAEAMKAAGVQPPQPGQEPDVAPPENTEE